MKIIVHKADTRGFMDHGWLKSFHTFSFAHYHHFDRMNFGKLRVLNDDLIDAGTGFDMHSHQNMEIVSIPLEGALQHKDNMGNTNMILKNDIQVMSAGTGIMHSEYNPNQDAATAFLQIWIIPNQQNVTPRYEQITLDRKLYTNTLFNFLSPNKEEGKVWIHQDAYMSKGAFEAEATFTYNTHDAKNGVYVFVLKGQIQVADNKLDPRDGIGISETKAVEISCQAGAEILVIEVPMV